MENTFVIPYQLGDKERLFDLGQGIHSSIALIQKKSGGKVEPFTRSMQKMKWQALAFGVLTVLQGALMGVGGFSVGKVVLMGLCALLGGCLWATGRTNKLAFGRAQQLYLQNNGKGGTITVDDEGFTERNENGKETRLDWEDYRCCVMCEEAIVVIFYRPVMLIVSRSEETEDGLLTALGAYGRLSTVYEVETGGKK